MVKKSLPKVKKSLKSFILEEDAKVMDKSMVKIAAVTSFAGAMFLDSIDNASAGFPGVANEYCHFNRLNVDLPTAGNIHNGINPTDSEYKDLTDKSITTIHGNHFNHANESSWGGLGGVFTTEHGCDKFYEDIDLSKYKMDSGKLNELNNENHNLDLNSIEVPDPEERMFQ